MNFSCKLEEWKTENKSAFFCTITSEGRNIYPSFVRIKLNAFWRNCIFLCKTKPDPSLPFRNETVFVYEFTQNIPFIHIYIYSCIYIEQKYGRTKDYSHRVLWRWRAVIEDGPREAGKGHKVTRTQGLKVTRSWGWTLRRKNNVGGLKWSFCGSHMTWHDIAWHDMTWQDMTWHDIAWHDSIHSQKSWAIGH